MRHVAVSLDDKHQLQEGRAFITGVQALIRILLDQRRLDEQVGLRTAGFVSGYRGSPLGGLDQQAQRAAAHLAQADVVFKEGLNEDLAATAVWGSQQVNLFPGARYDGVFGLWYGKAPGVDRSGDVFKHANFAGTWPKGGVLAVAGDDHSCKSSTLPSQSEFAFQDCEMPVLAPADVQEVLDYGLAGLAMSRFTGLWTGFIALADTMDSGMTIDVSLNRHRFVLPQTFVIPSGGLGIRTKDQPLEKERRLRHHKLPAALAWAKANQIDRTVITAPYPRLGIVCQGQAYRDVIEAFSAMGISLEQAAHLGVCLYKVGMPWPLEPSGLRRFATGLETLMVIEHRRALVEPQARAVLYDLPDRERPRIIGKQDERGQPLLAEIGALSVAEIALAIFDRLPEGPHQARALAYLKRVSAASIAAVTLASDQQRKPFFCSGCPHNSSTRLPEGSRALAGIGCHYLASFADPNTDMTSQMGGEGLSWVGSAPFTDADHIFANLGDGTYNHSGSLAIRAAIAAGATLTYKLLFNDAVAMTGGQKTESGFNPAQITRQLAAEGVVRTVIVADDPSRYDDVKDLAPGVRVRPRSDLMLVQDELRQIRGVTVLLYDQVCATEKRRRRKRGLITKPPVRAFINSLVCEGCGDCSRTSNCVAIEPLETPLGRKRRVNPSSCNNDLTCVEGFCPSFVTLEGADYARGETAKTLSADTIPEPQFLTVEGITNLVFTGIGGTGVTTVASILAMAAHLEGRAASVLDMTGLAQKGGSVISHVRIGRTETCSVGGRVAAASANIMIACDLLVAAGPEALSVCAKDRTRAFGNMELTPTAEFVTQRDIQFDAGGIARRLSAATRSYQACAAKSLAEEQLGDAIYANMIMLGFTWQHGLVPVSSAALYQAITLNGVDVALNRQAFEIGRQETHRETHPSVQSAPSPQGEALDELIDRRSKDLIAYQNRAYADRYGAYVAKIRAAEQAVGGQEVLTRTVAINLYRLMAYKDEYEVARLYSDGRFAAERDQNFVGGKIKIWLSPPVLSPKGPDGLPKKIALPGWIIDWCFPILARLKPVRGTSFDPFGQTEERRAERGLMGRYEADLEQIIRCLDADHLTMAIEIAALPDVVRGYGHVKASAMAKIEAQRKALWQAWGVRQPQL